MKIQGIVDAVVDVQAAWARELPTGAPGKSKGSEGPAAANLPSSPPPEGRSRELERVAEAIRKFIQENRTTVDFTVDAELKQIVTRVIEEDSGKVIRQYPDDVALAIMKHLKDLRGILLNKEG